MLAGQALYQLSYMPSQMRSSHYGRQIGLLSPEKEMYAKDYQSGNVSEFRWKMEMTLEITVLVQVS